MALDHIPKSLNEADAEKGFWSAYGRMRRYEAGLVEDGLNATQISGNLGYKALRNSVDGYVMDLDVLLFADEETLATLVAANNGRENGQACEPQIVTVIDSRL